MTLEEYLAVLPESHRARREYRELVERSKCYVVKADESNNPPESVEEGRLNVDIWVCPILGANKAMQEELKLLREAGSVPDGAVVRVGDDGELRWSRVTDKLEDGLVTPTRELLEKVSELTMERDSVLEVLNGSSSHFHLDRYRDVDRKMYDRMERWFKMCTGLVIELQLGSCYDDTPGLFSMRVKSRIAKLEARIKTLEHRALEDVEDYELCPECNSAEWVYWESHNEAGEPLKDPVLRCMSCEKEEAQRAISELPVAIGLMSVAAKAGDWEKFNQEADKVVTGLTERVEIAVTMTPRKKALQILEHWTPDMVDRLINELIAGRYGGEFGVEALAELYEWYNRHTNATGPGPTSPPKPLEGGTVVVAGETSEGGDGNKGGD